jgi:RimJ/RimL family protein N-acetyltransferase
MIKPEPLDGDGVRLRLYRADDAADVAAACSDPLTRRFLPQLPDPYGLDEARWWIGEGAPAAWAAGGAAYAVADPTTDRLLGGVGLGHVMPDRATGEIGYWVAPWARRRGVATAATRALAAHAFTCGLARLELFADMANPASQRVAFAAGFGHEGVRRHAAANRDGTRRDLVAFARLATDPAGPAPRLLPDLPGGELTDGVATLRPLGPADAEFYFGLLNTPDVVETMVPPLAPDREEVGLRCARAEYRWLAGERADLVIVDAASGRPAGDIGLYYQEPATNQAMIGYCMLPELRGRGLATRACVLLARWVLAQTDIGRLIAGTNPTNTGSQRVLERAGFRREGYQRGRLPAPDGGRVDDVLFGLLPGDLPVR